MEIIYDADTISYRDLLEFFFQIHDPTTPNQQGDEKGRYVRSAIFYTSEGQARLTLTPSRTWMRPAVARKGTLSR